MTNQLLYRGSVKDVYQLSGSEESSRVSRGYEELLFSFTDRYSIFDWGVMPDAIPGKGLATARLTSYLYGLISGIVPTHFLDSNELRPHEIKVKKFHVPARDGYEAFYAKLPLEAFLPLEVIYRFGVPQGSSLLKRGYQAGEKFSKPLIEFSTKLEPQDRMLSDPEAMQIAGLSESEFLKLKTITGKLAVFLKDLIAPTGIELWDGKVEFAFTTPGGKKDSEREFILVDSIGLDEMRLTRLELNLSKEILRQKYRVSAWFKALTVAKEKSADHFRELCTLKPQPLPEDVIALVSRLYALTTEVIMGDSSKLQELDFVLKQLK